MRKSKFNFPPRIILSVSSTKQKQFSNLIIYGIGQFFNLATPLLVIPYIISVCGEAGYGKISVGMAIAFFLIVFVDYGSDIVGVKEVAVARESNEQLEKIFLTTYASKMCLFIAVCAISSLVFIFVPYFCNEKTLFLLSLSILLGQLVNPTWFLQGIENFKWIAAINIVSKGLYVCGVFTLIRVPSDYIYTNLIWGLGMLVPNLVAFAYLMYSREFSFQYLILDEVKQQIKRNFSIFSSQIFVSLQMYSPIVLISFFGNNAMAGQYKIVDQVIVIFKTYILLFFNYAYPRVCYLLDKNVKEGMRFWKTYNGVNLLFICASMVVIFIFSEQVVGYFNPSDPVSVAFLLRIAVCIPILQAFGVPLKQLVLGFNKQKEYVRLTMITTILGLFMIVLITPFFKITGVFLAFICTELVIIASFFATIKSKLRSD